MNTPTPLRLTAGLAGLLVPTLLLAHEPTLMDKTIITGRADSLLNVADASSEGYIGQDHLEYRPLLRAGEVLETVPGVIVTQHSGDGKANQYFLRGFNLDHGTDFATSVDGVPVNLPTHAHGQGYTDLNFLIPELVQTVHYRKGPYYADVGDFGSAGAADLSYVDSLDRGLAKLEGGSFGYARGLFAASSPVSSGNLLYAVDLEHNDGPWHRPEDYQKINGVLRYSRQGAETGFNITAMAYGGTWNSSDQIASRAVPDLAGGRFGEISPSDGGTSHRASLSLEWHRETEAGHTQIEVYGVYYDLNLFSDFTYYLNSPLGDQFEQQDRRGIGGLKAHHTWRYDLLGREAETTVGLQVRSDSINNGIYQTVDRRRTDKPDFGGGIIPATTRADDVWQASVSPYVEQKVKWTDWLRSTSGVRADYYHFDVADRLAQNSGTKDSALVSPKGGLVFGPWRDTEFYLSGGLGFHSNDGRGTTTRVDPQNPASPVTPVTALVRTYGAEVGVRTVVLPHLQSTASLWWLDIDSELVFDGDGGTTEPSRPSRRYGIEFANYYTPTKWLTFDADFSWSHARFRDFDPVGQYIPESIETVVAAGVSVHDPDPERGFFASLRLRYFGPRALIEDNSERSGATVLLNAQAGYRFNRTWSFAVEAFNLLDRKDSDIDYYYASRLPGEPAGGVNDFHFHPVEPLSARATLTARF
jgi:TonB dependent receptor/TonB-dependent Receptor Plug Domain